MTEQQEHDLKQSVMPSVTVYSDGSYKPVLHTGGYGTIMTCNNHCLFSYGGLGDTSNNAMELAGALQAIRQLTVPCRVNIITDSRYVVDGINSWMMKWAANGWCRADGRPISNMPLWQEMFEHAQHHMIYATWIRGHAGNFNNQICDHFACIGAYKAACKPIPPALLADTRL